ncbi:MAG: hypothetical protein HMLIMOIP_002563 [Candidatus Nitrosomirales archaeon]|jgi:hypothetical protein
MESTQHAFLGELTGNPYQPQGRHEEGIGFIPLGDRDRYKAESNEVMERDSDPNIRRI